jgi:hypothetical protein
VDTAGCVLASDAFFPFPDSLDWAKDSGATAVIEPGGAKKDQDVIARADELGLAMIFTGTRHFNHQARLKWLVRKEPGSKGATGESRRSIAEARAREPTA